MGDEVTVGVHGRTWAPTVIAVRATGSGGARRGPLRGADERGAVTAEAAVVVPLLLAVALGLVWLVALSSTQVRVVDAARETARAAARGDDDATAVARGAQVAPSGAAFDVSRSGEEVVVRVVAEVQGPGGLLSFLPPVVVRSEAVAAAEPR